MQLTLSMQFRSVQSSGEPFAHCGPDRPSYTQEDKHPLVVPLLKSSMKSLLQHHNSRIHKFKVLINYL